MRKNKLVLLFLLAVSLAFGFQSCDKDKEDSPALEIKTCALSTEETELELNSELKLSLETNISCAVIVRIQLDTIEAKDGVYILPTDKVGEYVVSVEFNNGQNESQTRNLKYKVVFPRELSFTVNNGVSFKMKLVSGYHGGDFYMAETETTQALWTAVMGFNPSCTEYPEGIGDNYPVNQVSWNDIHEGDESFLKKLNAVTGKSFRLPSSLEWSWAANSGDSEEELKDYAWYSDSIGDVDGCREVATKKPNRYGLYDIKGNVFEWCEDLINGSYRVVRGGCWNSYDYVCAYELYSNPDKMDKFNGFRLALNSKSAINE